MENIELPGLEESPYDYTDEIARCGADLALARRRVELTSDKLRVLVLRAIGSGHMSELEASKLAGVTRATVRRWQGK